MRKSKFATMKKRNIHMRSLYRQGWTLREIAAYIGISQTRVNEILVDLGVKLRPRGVPVGRKRAA